MHKIKFLTILGLTGSVYATGGYYVGIGAGYSSLTGTVQSPYVFNDGSTGSQSAASFASTFYFGYDFNKVIGVQFDYNAAWNAVGNSYNLNQQLLGGSALFHLPFSIISDSLAGLDVYAKGGLAYNAINFGNINPNGANCVYPPSSTNGISPLVGAGVEYGFKNVGYRLEWDYAGSIMSSNYGNNQVSTSSNSYLFSILYHF